MKIDLKAQNPLEWLAATTGFIPKPVLLAHFGFILSKVIWEAVDSGVLEAIAQKQQTPTKIARHCGLNENAVTALLNALAGLQIVRFSKGKFTLTAGSKKWLLKNSPQSYRSQLSFDNQVCYDWMSKTGDYLRTGQGFQYHQTLQPDEWALYQNGMEATSHLISQVAARKIRLRTTANRLLDIGGSHGLYSSALLKKYPQLSAQVLDLPEAVAANVQKPNPFPGRLVYTAGDILKDSLEPESYDAIIMANVAHHFTEAENLLVAKKVLAALKQSGTFYILEFLKKDVPDAVGDMIGALQSFFFAFSSTSGLWTAHQMESWLQQTGFKNVKTSAFLQLPGFALIQGKKP